ncbi:P-type ATPase, partial [Baffinella frigidus]
AQVVPGDVILIHSGDRIPADLRLIEVHTLQIQEAMLTGESNPVTKKLDVFPEDTVLADRKNIAFTATMVRVRATLRF